MSTTIDDIFTELEVKSNEQIDFLRKELAKLRTGRANPNLVEGLRIEYYGTMTPLSQVGSIKVPEPRQIVIEPWDKSVLREIEKVIAHSDLGVSPVNDGQVIRVTLPPLTEERRKDIAKMASTKAEEVKGHLRNLRNRLREHLKNDVELSEDDFKREEKALQEEFDNIILKVDEMRDKKIAEIMEV